MVIGAGWFVSTGEPVGRRWWWGKALGGICACLWLGGCSFGTAPFESPTKKAARRPDPVVSAPSTTSLEARLLEAPSAEITDIELVWEVPTEPVDGFIVRYGENREALVTEKKLAVQELETRTDAERGGVYRYVIRGIPSTQRLFLTVAAFKGDVVSVPTQVFEVVPGVPR